jgi:hypothetical protein
MQTVFVSYSHTDSDFVDGLVLDLRESEVPATYDKWLLRVGDSIIERERDLFELGYATRLNRGAGLYFGL